MKKSTLIVIASIISVFLILIVAIPHYFKDEIKDEILHYVNEQTEFDVTVNDYSLSLISNFPKFTFSFEGVTVIDSEKKEILSIEGISAEIDSKDFIIDRSIAINRISLINPTINYKLNSDTTEVKNVKHENPEELSQKSDPINNEEQKTKKSLSLNISSYEIVGASIKVKDENDNNILVITNLNHNGFGIFKDEILSLNTVTFIDNINIYSDNSSLLKNAQIKGELNIDLDFKNKIYSLKENSLSINKIKLNWVGVIKEIENNIDIDLRFDSPNTKFKDLLAMIPEAYQKDFDKIETKGQFKVEGNILGIYNDETLPEFNFKTSITDAYIKYPDLPESIDDIELVMKINKPQGNDLDKITIDIPKAIIKISDNEINASMTVHNLITDPHLKTKILANFDLAKLHNAIPLDKNESINGEIYADIFIKGKISDLEKERYDKFDAKGDITLSNFQYHSKIFKESILITSANISISPKNLILKNFDFKLGKSDIKAKGTISKYLEYTFENKVLYGNLDIKSNYFYAEDFMPIDTTSTKQQSTQPTNSSASDNASDDEFAMEVIDIPSKINFDNNISINHFVYGSIKADNVKGHLGIKNKDAYLKNTSFNILDGSIVMDGNYSSKKKNSPTADFKIDAKKIDIQKLSHTFLWAKQIAPIITNTSGKLNIKFNIKTNLDSSMNPVYETMFSNGLVTTKDLSLKNTDFLKDFGDVLNVKELKNDPKIEDIKLSYVIKKGIMTISPFNLNVADIKSQFVGSSNIGKQTVDMNASIIFPRKYLGSETNALIDNAVSLANTFGANVKMGETIDVDAKIKGDIKSPKYSLTYGPNKAETAEQFLKQQADKIIEDAKKDAGKDLEKKATDFINGLFK